MTSLPTGATAKPWEDDDTRVINGRPAALPGRPDVFVIVTAIQGRDGRIDTTDQPPLIVVDGASGGLNATQARALALRLLDAANEAQAWLQ